MNRLKIGVLSVSNHLLKRIVLPLKNTKYCKIYGIASRNPKKAEAFAQKFDIEKVYADYQELIEDPIIDFVYIPLPNHLHLEWVVKAAEAGKHILCEKPIALNAQEAMQCIEAAQKNKVQLMEAFMYKFHPLWIYAKEVITTNQIGRIMYIHTSFAYHNPAPDNIRNIKEFGGGALMDIGCYAISSSRFLLDAEPQRVMAIHQQHPEFKTDTLGSAIMDYDGRHASYTVSTLSQANQGVDIVGSSGRIRIPVPFNTYVDTPSEIIINTAQGERSVSFAVCDQYGLMFDAFSECLIKKMPLPIEPTDVLNNMKVIDAVFKSAQSQQWERL
ncbi:Predicted dehydrogenase [Saccharicrinis carchari]|uniref:Predicted dehydrogenase n=1 Tax=Saccharicrinis carchari TaxID=1168039 RepID=A0A521CMN1_SACCC|nr:Gfo/Idh/MocA family oxidoreductase [Saccharicrinis carchari]SMO60694.1 Predicted dehydrogenase [Saccharicrinis carchari]